MIYLAADPGMNGALAAIDDNSRLVDRIVTPRIGSKGKVDLAAEYEFINSVARLDKTVFVIEDVHALYGVSVSATSSLMENKGELHGLLFSFTMRYEASLHFIAPKTWQKEVWTHYDKVFKANKVDTKATSLSCAKRLWPTDTFFKNDKCRVAHDGIVDAMLIAEAARRMNL